MTQTDFPIMIIGEAGTGKERVAGAVYTQSPLHHNPMVVIDFTMMNDKSWTFLKMCIRDRALPVPAGMLYRTIGISTASATAL